MKERIRRVLDDHGRLPVSAGILEDEANLYSAGMTSHASVNVMLALEEEFDVEFPDEMLTRNAFESIDSIASSLTTLGVS
ncbi:MAG TPA: acyl carrier protein [Gaiellaceae bacterium]|nr:acyl carrier protein [Gaiellaceae bacterium]